MKQRLNVRAIALSGVFGAMAFIIRRFSILVIPMPVWPLVMDLRGIPALVGACLVPVYYAWFIGWAASGFDFLLEFGVDFAGWIPACIVCSWLFRRLRKPLSRVPFLNPALSILLGQIAGTLIFLPVFIVIYQNPWDMFVPTLIILLGRVALTFIGAAPIVHTIEKRLGKMIMD